MLLSGKELVEHGKRKTSGSLPAKCSKEILPNGSWLEKKQIENSLDVKKKLLADHRVEKRGSLSLAEWKEELQKAVVIEKKGPYWSYIGHCDALVTYLYPEEVLFLIETNSLLLQFEGILISIQQAYLLLLGKSITLDEYRVYSNLMREGYKLIRHDDSRIYSDSEKNPENVEKKNYPDSKINETKPSSANSVEKSNIVSEPSNSCLQENEVIEVDDSWYDKVDIFNSIIDCYQKKKVHVKVPKIKRLPSNIKPLKNEYVLELGQGVENEQDRRKSIDTNKEIDFDIPLDMSCKKKELRFNDREVRKSIESDSIVNSNSNRNVYNPFALNQPSTSKTILHPNPYSIFLTRSFNRKSKKKSPKSNKTVQNDNRDLPLNLTKDDMITNRTRVEIKKENAKKIENLLHRMNNLITSFERSDNVVNEEMKNSLDAILNEYNINFNEKYKANERLFSNIDASNSREKNHNGEVLQVSSDSDTDLNSPTKKRKHEQGINENTTKRTKTGENSISEHTESIEPQSNAVLSRKWYVNNIWNKPEEDINSSKEYKKKLNWAFNFLRAMKKCNAKYKYLTNWEATKALYRRTDNNDSISTSDDESEIGSPEQYLIKTDKIKPIIKSSDCTSIYSVLSNLQIIPVQYRHSESAARISYDVYLPNSKKFRKSELAAPSYVLVIRSLSSPVLKSEDVVTLRKKIPNATMILVAIVSPDSIFFMQIENLILPNFVNKVDNNNI